MYLLCMFLLRYRNESSTISNRWNRIKFATGSWLGVVVDLHFVRTEQARAKLVAEGSRSTQFG